MALETALPQGLCRATDNRKHQFLVPWQSGGRARGRRI